MTRNTTLLLPFLAASCAMGQLSYTDTFEPDRNVGQWSWGNSFERIVLHHAPDGGRWRFNFNLSTCCPTVATRRSKPTIFTGNYRELGVSSIGIDTAVLYAGNFPVPCDNWPSGGGDPRSVDIQPPLQSFRSTSRPATPRSVRGLVGGQGGEPNGRDGDPGIWIILITDNGTPGNTDDDWGAYTQTKLTASTPVGEGEDAFTWFHYDLEIDPNWLDAETMPDGWTHIAFGPDSPEQPDWTMLITNVSQVAYQLNNPGMFHLLRSYQVGVANPRITINPSHNLPDCDGSGTPDVYDIAVGDATDCNRNGIPDSCDLANGLDTDCSGTGTLDSCHRTAANYRFDDGFIDDGIGTNFAPEDSKLLWANRFDAGDGDTITNIAVSFHGGGGLQPGDPVDIYLWDDPNNDGSPDDAVLLTTTSASVLSTNELTQSDRASYDAYAIEPTSVSGTFFVGVATAGETFPASTDITEPIEGLSWSATLEPGNEPTTVFQSAGTMLDDCMGGLFMIRANINDADNNGIPDDCETTGPPADLTGDGIVNVFDLLELLGQWGECDDPNDCPADLTEEGTVNVFDLLDLLGQWG